MRTIVSIMGVELEPSRLAQLLALYPDGQQRGTYRFEIQLPAEDVRVPQLLRTLEQMGRKPWNGKGRSVIPAEFKLTYHREYDADDYASCELLEFDAQWDYPHDEVPIDDPVTRVFTVPRHCVDPRLDFLRVSGGGDRFLVPDRVKRVLERGGLHHLVVRPTQMAVPRRSRQGGVQDDSGDPWWEIDSDFTLPPLSPTMQLIDLHKKHPIRAGEQREGVRPIEPPYLKPELHYRRSDLVNLPPFDLARTHEWMGYRWDDAALICTRRFYELCVESGLKTTWIPVRIDEDS